MSTLETARKLMEHEAKETAAEAASHMPAPIRGDASPEALTYGVRMASAYFQGRKGHGNGPVGYVTLDRNKLAAIMAIAFDAGRGRK